MNWRAHSGSLWTCLAERVGTVTPVTMNCQSFSMTIEFALVLLESTIHENPAEAL